MLPGKKKHISTFNPIAYNFGLSACYRINFMCMGRFNKILSSDFSKSYDALKI